MPARLKPVFGLPGQCFLIACGLFILTAATAGLFFETNDDVTLSLLLRGLLREAPETELYLYFHGLGSLISGLYQLMPALPWYGIVLYSLLLFSASAAIWLVLKACSAISWKAKILLLILLFLTGWVEHVMWFNFGRPSVLLGGIGLAICGLQFDKSFSRKKWLPLIIGTILFSLGWAIRPSGAWLGAVVAMPGLLQLESGRIKQLFLRLLPLLLMGALLHGVHKISLTPAEQKYRAVNEWKSRYLDYHQFRPDPKSKADSLALEAVQRWFLADREVVNEAFFHQAGKVDWQHFWQHTVFKKAKYLLVSLPKDQSLALAINAICLLSIFTGMRSSSRHWQLIGLQVLLWLVIFTVGVVLKLPPRVLTSCLTIYTLLNVITWLRLPSGFNKSHYQLAAVTVLLLVGVQLYKIRQRSQFQTNRQNQHELFLKEVRSQFNNQLLVTANFGWSYASLSPFRNYDFGSNKILELTGWNTLQPNFPPYLKSLTGQAELSNAIHNLAQQDTGIIWILPKGFDFFLINYFADHHRLHLDFTQLPIHSYAKTEANYQFFRARIRK